MRFRNLSSPKVAIQWILQCFLVFVLMLVFLFSLGDLEHNVLAAAIGTTSIGSSAFLAFVAHDSPMAHNSRLLGGYVIAVVVGGIMHYIAYHFAGILPLSFVNSLWFFAALATGIAMMIMTLVELPHAPAAGLSLGMTMRFWDYKTLLVVSITVLLIAGIKTLLKPWLINLTHDKKA